MFFFPENVEQRNFHVFREEWGGAGGVMVVVVNHLCEQIPWIQWCTERPIAFDSAQNFHHRKYSLALVCVYMCRARPACACSWIFRDWSSFAVWVRFQVAEWKCSPKDTRLQIKYLLHLLLCSCTCVERCEVGRWSILRSTHFLLLLRFCVLFSGFVDIIHEMPCNSHKFSTAFWCDSLLSVAWRIHPDVTHSLASTCPMAIMTDRNGGKIARKI